MLFQISEKVSQDWATVRIQWQSEPTHTHQKLHTHLELQAADGQIQTYESRHLSICLSTHTHTPTSTQSLVPLGYSLSSCSSKDSFLLLVLKAANQDVTREAFRVLLMQHFHTETQFICTSLLQHDTRQPQDLYIIECYCSMFCLSPFQLCRSDQNPQHISWMLVFIRFNWSIHGLLDFVGLFCCSTFILCHPVTDNQRFMFHSLY